MANRSCPQCGYPLTGTETQCPECGMAFSANIQNPNGMQNANFGYDEGDNDAEEILERVVNFLKWLITIFSIGGSIVIFIMGIGLLFQGYGESILIGIVCIVGSVINLLLGLWFAKLVWALGMIFINISNNVRAIKKLIQFK